MLSSAILSLNSSISSNAHAGDVKVTKKNRSLFQIIRKSNSDSGIQQLACFKNSANRYVLGIISGGRFRRTSANDLSDADKKAAAKSRTNCRAAAQNALRPKKPTRPVTNPTRAPVSTIAIPQLALWQSNMTKYGATHCVLLKNSGASFDNRLAATYYDGQWVYQQIAAYTKDQSWLSCAAAAESVYRDQYVVTNGGKVPGYWNFSHGIARDYLSTGDPISRNAEKLLAFNASYAPDATPLSWTVDSTMSREVAYAIMAYINAEDMGEPRRARLSSLVDQALGHLDQWFVSKSAPYIRPFMVALTSQALITYYERTGDSRIIPALRNAADKMWDTLWIASAQSFKYTDRETDTGGTGPAPDLNLLIAPVYGFLYHQTGEARFQQRGDEIFVGGTQGAYLTNAKQFNQSYRWSFAYVDWRSSTPLR